ncbi:SDR family NAD(P)-dependent oxidoreductase [Streptosporangium sp. NPDC001681]|uniref:SDR family NAD(P)-dependent oxidoreductase n=1 Tax=Streptosporangium sp. NPDC001681 TaxID=3154395 RepID=UPI0033171F1A
MLLTGFEGKVALVTGAARMRSIGRSIALGLAGAGCDVAVTGTDRPPEAFPEHERNAGWQGLASVATEIAALGRRCVTITTDGAANEENAGRVLDEAVRGLGRVDILVNNAAASRGADRVSVAGLDPAVWDTVIGTNLTGSFQLSRVVARHLLARKEGGSIVNISSIGGKLMGARTAAYSASKAGLHALTSAMAQELGPEGIRVNAVCPGIVRTSRLDDLPDEAWDRIIETTVPLRRAGDPGDVANLVVFLCSDQGSWVTGQAWNIDGGQLTIH